MAVVQVRGDGVVAKASVIGEKAVDIAHQDGFTVPGVIHRPRAYAVVSPNRLQGKIGGHTHLSLSLRHLVQLNRWKRGQRLMADGASFTGRGVGGDCRCRIERRYRLLHLQDGQRLDKCTRCRARSCVPIIVASMPKCPGTGAEAIFSYQEARAGDQSHAHKVAPRESRLDEFQTVLSGVINISFICHSTLLVFVESGVWPAVWIAPVRDESWSKHQGAGKNFMLEPRFRFQPCGGESFRFQPSGGEQDQGETSIQSCFTVMWTGGRCVRDL